MKYLLVIAIAIFGLATVTFGQTIPSYVPTIGLVGWWPFNGNANDESLNGMDLSIYGPTLTTDRFGNSNKAYSFQGSPDNAQYMLTNQISNLSSSEFSFSIWFNSSQFNPNQTPSNPYDFANFNIQCLLSINSNNWDVGNKIACCLDYDNSKIIYEHWTSQNGGQYLTSSSIIEINNWYNVTVTFSNNYATVYLNSIFLYTFNTEMDSSNQVDLLIGGRRNGPEMIPMGGFKGVIDDFAWWNRALSQQEINNLYNATNCSNNLTISPSSNQLASGSTANFTAATSDTFPSFIWQSDFGQGYVTLNNYGNYSGVNTNSLSISDVQLSEHNQPIRVISTSGECIDTSNVATINITDTCIVTINDTITTLISVTDTLIINTQITGLTPPNNTNTIKVFPNPANSHITIDFGNFESMNGYTLTITNSIGQTVYTTPINEQSSYIDLSAWSGNGIYFVQIIDTLNNTIENRKIVLQ
jgi:hypothetical protein